PRASRPGRRPGWTCRRRRCPRGRRAVPCAWRSSRRLSEDLVEELLDGVVAEGEAGLEELEQGALVGGGFAVGDAHLEREAEGDAPLAGLGQSGGDGVDAGLDALLLEALEGEVEEAGGAVGGEGVELLVLGELL